MVQLQRVSEGPRGDTTLGEVSLRVRGLTMSRGCPWVALFCAGVCRAWPGKCVKIHMRNEVSKLYTLAILPLTQA